MFVRLHHEIPGIRSYNIAPSQEVWTIRFNPATNQRSLDPLRCGLIPHWAEDKRIAFRTINARRETLDTAPSFKRAFRRRRCLIPADGFYEWRLIGGPGGAKVPIAISMKDDSPFEEGNTELWNRLHEAILTVVIAAARARFLYDEAVQHKNDRLTKALQLDALVVIRDGLGSGAMFRAAGSVGVSAQRE